METEQVNGLLVKPSTSMKAASTQAPNDSARLRRLWSGACSDASRRVSSLVGGFLAVLIFMQAGQTGLHAAGLNANATRYASFRSYAYDVEAHHLIDFIALGSSPVFGQEEHEAGIDGSFRAGVDEAFRALGQIKTADRPPMLGPSHLQLQDLALALCADRRAGSVLPSHALQPPSFGPALSWLTSKARAERNVCDSALPMQQPPLMMLPYDVAQPGADVGLTTNDLLRFGLDTADDAWAVRRGLDDPRSRIDVPLAAAKQPARRQTSGPRWDRSRLIAQAAFPNASTGNASKVRPIDPFAIRSALPRPAIGSPIVPRGQSQARAPASDVVVNPAIAREIYSLAALEPPRLILRDAVQGDREKALVFDDGWILANRFKVPLGRLSFSHQDEDSRGGTISLVPFLDTGTVWNSETVTYPIASDPFGIGAGIGWQITDATDVRLGIDIPVGGDETEGADDSSDLGFQFRIATTLGD